MMGTMEISGIGGILLLLVDLWAIIHVVGSRASPFGKAVWIVLVLLLPLVGFLIWLLFGPRSARD